MKSTHIWENFPAKTKDSAGAASDPSPCSTRLKIGMRVKMSAEGLSAGLDGRLKRRTGVIRSWSKQRPDCVIVQRDGEKSGHRFHHSFWKPDIGITMSNVSRQESLADTDQPKTN